MLKEFREFIQRGNVLDMAVGVIMAGAFGKIIDSLVADVLMPIISLITAGADFTEWKLILRANPEVAISYGNLIQVILNFILVAFCIFLIVKGFNKMRRNKEEAPAKSDEVLLLEEIRDSLKNK